MKTSWFYEEYESYTFLAQVMDDICLSCPVRETCLEEGIANQEYGLWGGAFLINGRYDASRNAHKSEEVKQLFIRSGVTD